MLLKFLRDFTINQSTDFQFSLQFSRKDPVHSVPLKDFVVGHLNLCQTTYGQEQFDNLMSQVDSEILQQLHGFS